MTTGEYFKKLLPYYRGMYDMEAPYLLHGMECLAHGHFYSHNEKFVLSKEAKLWESNQFEHVFFIERDRLGEEDLSRMDALIRDHIEPELVRKGEKYPAPNHMYTYITFVFLCSSPIGKDVVKSVKNYHYSRNYLLSVRGFCDARLVVAVPESRTVITNRSGAALKKLFTKVLD